jgi:hypothetical protein
MGSDPFIPVPAISRYERETRIPASGSLRPLAATLARHRRHLSAGDPELLATLHPGYLIGADADRSPQLMILVGPVDVA